VELSVLICDLVQSTKVESDDEVEVVWPHGADTNHLDTGKTIRRQG
jgi:hypothetical protein